MKKLQQEQVNHEESSDHLNQSLRQHSIDRHQLKVEIDEQHRLGFINWLPLILVILPNLAPIFFDGEPESWRRSIIFLLVVFFLYKISKAPWQLYASARTTRIFKQLGVNHSTQVIYPSQSASHQASLTELNRMEIGFLLLAMSSPAIGIGLLIYLQSKLDLGLEYLNSHSTVSFLLASLVKPLGHLQDRVLQRSRYLQSQLEFPAQSAEQLNESFENLASKLNQLEMDSLTKVELANLKKNQIDPKLMKISNRLSQFEKSEQIFQTKSFNRLSKLERTLAETLEKLEKAELSFHSLRFNKHFRSSPLDSISKVFTRLLNPQHHSENIGENGHIAHTLVQQPHYLSYKLADPNMDGPLSLTNHAATTSDEITKKPQIIQPIFNPSRSKNYVDLCVQLISNLFNIGSCLNIIRTGLERVAIQILNGIRYPIAIFNKVLSCSFTFVLSFYLILRPIQMLKSMTKTKSVKSTADRDQVKFGRPIETSSINGHGNIRRHQIRNHPTRRTQNHHLRSRPRTNIHDIDLRIHHPPSSSALSSSSSSEHQSPPLQSPPISSNLFDSSPHQIHQHLHQKIAHPHLTHIDPSDPHSLYHFHS